MNDLRELFFQVAILRDFQRLCDRIDRGLFSDITDTPRRDIFELEGDGVTLLSHLSQGRLIGIVGLDMHIGDHAGTAHRVRIKHYGTVPHGARCKAEHSTELTATQNAQR